MDLVSGSIFFVVTVIVLMTSRIIQRADWGRQALEAMCVFLVGRTLLGTFGWPACLLSIGAFFAVQAVSRSARRPDTAAADQAYAFPPECPSSPQFCSPLLDEDEEATPTNPLGKDV